MGRTPLHISLALISPFFLVFTYCTECKECTYYEKTGNAITYEEKLDGEYCGDEIKSLEKKEFNTTSDEAYVRCQ